MCKQITKLPATIGFIALALLAISHQAIALDPVLKITPSITTNTTLAPKIASQLKLGMIISSVNHSGNCVKKNTLITITGQNFGSTSTGKRIVFKDNSAHVHKSALTWSKTKISIRFPGSLKLKSGRKYSVAVENTADKLLSNATKTVSVCQPFTAQIAPQKAKISIGIQNPSEDFSYGTDDNGSTVGKFVPIAGGSLLDAGFPPPPEDLPPLPVKKDKTIEPSELVVASPNMAQAQALAKKARSMGLRVKRRRHLKSLGMVVSVFGVSKEADVGDAINQLRRAAPKTWVDTNTRYTLQGDESKHYGAKLIGWNKISNGKHCGTGARVGMVDTGIDASHPALKGQSIVSRSFLSKGLRRAKVDHGTATASLLVGNNQALDLAGLISGAKLFVGDVFRQRGADNVDTTVEWIVLALDWLASQHVQIINLGLGGPRNLLIEAAINRLMARNIIIVAAAGNGGPTAKPVYPAAQKGVIAVTAVDTQLQPYRKANRGNYISLAAPGVDIWVAKASGQGHYVSGTSYAAPFVTASLVAAKLNKPKTPWRDIQSNLINATRDLGRPGRDPVFGWGLVQAMGKCKN